MATVDGGPGSTVVVVKQPAVRNFIIPYFRFLFISLLHLLPEDIFIESEYILCENLSRSYETVIHCMKQTP